MGKPKKNSDLYISKGTRYLYRTRRILLILSFILLLVNMLLLGVLDNTKKETAIGFALIAVIIVVIQLVDNRSSHWEWPYIILLSSVLQLFSAFCAFTTELLFLKYLMVGEILFLSFFMFLLIRKKKKR